MAATKRTCILLKKELLDLYEHYIQVHQGTCMQTFWESDLKCYRTRLIMIVSPPHFSSHLLLT